jgi:hypothetical protein
MGLLNLVALVLSVATTVACGGGGSSAGEPPNRPPVARAFDMGFTPWPYDDPAVEAGIQSRLDNTPANQRTYLAISPFSSDRTGLAGNWGAAPNEPLPAPWNVRDFDSPEVIAAYTSFARDLITRFQPTYFNLGIEASELTRPYNDPTCFS